MAGMVKPIVSGSTQGMRQKLWERIRPFGIQGGDFGLLELLLGGELAHKTLARDYLLGLAAAGYIEPVPTPVGRRHEARYKFVRDNGVEAPRVNRDGSPMLRGLAEEQMWRALRMLTNTTCARELAAYASTEAISVSERQAADYLDHLHRASYLRLASPASGRGRRAKQARYKLISHTGPKPPIVQRTDAIYDPNLDAVVWIKPINEETAIYGQP